MGFFQTTHNKSSSSTAILNKVISLTSEQFVAQPTGGYIATVNHNLNTQFLIVSVFDYNKKEMLGCVTLKDDNTLEIYNDEAINCTVVINGSSTDLSDYATKQELSNKAEKTHRHDISEIDGFSGGGDIDLSAYATKVELEERVSQIELTPGPKGEKGEAGTTPNITIGEVTTLESGLKATVTKTGTLENPIFNFGIPKGDKGEGSGNTEIVNDLVTGGVDKALSAEQGKVLNEQYDNIVTEFDEVLASVTNGNENITNSEIVNARCGEVNLGNKIRKIDEQLDNKAKKDETFLRINGININDFDESTRKTFLEAQGIDVNYVLGERNVKTINTDFFKVNVNLADLVTKIPNKTIALVSGIYNIKDVVDSNSYVTDFVDISNIPTGKMVVIRGADKGMFLRYDVNKTLISGYKDNNRVYYKEENAKYIRIANTFNSAIQTEIYALGENAEEYFKDEYDKYNGLFKNEDNIFNKNKAVFGYWFNGTTLSHQFSSNMYIYGYIDISNKNEIYLEHNSAKYRSFNIGFYDENYSLIKVVNNKVYYNISDDTQLINAKWAIIGSMNSYDTNSKEQLNDVVVSFKPIINTPKQRKINKEFIDERIFLRNGWYGLICDSLGDSLTEANSFQVDIKNKLGLLSFDNHGIGGTTMLGSGSNAMWQDVRINALNKNANLITIMAGTNDYGAIFNSQSHAIGDISLSNIDTNTYVGSYNTCIKKIYNKYNGDIQILIMTPLYNPIYPVEKFVQIIDACIEIAKMWNIPYIDLYRECGFNSYNANTWWTESDRIHPKREAYTKKISPVICSKIKSLEPII